MTSSLQTYQNISNLTTKASRFMIDEVNNDIFLKVYIPSFVYTFIIMLFCCFGNTMVIYVYMNRPRKTAARDFIIALAVFDLINGFITLPTELAFMWNIFRWDNAPVCKMSRFLTFWMNYSSSMTLLFIAIDRYRRICKPQDIPFNTKQNIILICFGVVVSVVLTWPAILVYGIQTIPYPVPEIMNTVVGSTCLIDDIFSKSVYPVLFNVTVMILTILFDFIFVTIYILIAIKIKRHVSFQENLDTRIVRSLAMLFLVTLLFMVSFLPYCIMSVIRYFSYMKNLELSDSLKAVYQFFFRSYLLSMGMNPVIYSFMSKQFRDESKAALKRLCKKCF